MKRIASKENPIFKALFRMGGSARERKSEGKCLLDGIHLVGAAIAGGILPDLIVVRESSEENPEIRTLLADHEAVLMEAALFDRISPVKTPTGILALVPIPEWDPSVRAECCIFLESIQDPGNMGSILRSAAASGATDAFLSEGCADPWSPKVLRSGMGAHFGIRIHADSDIELRMRNFEGNTVALTLEAETSLFDLDLKGNVGFVIGNEGAGISQRILSVSKIRAKIPMPGKIESLNAAQAAAICLFERVRQRA